MRPEGRAVVGDVGRDAPAHQERRGRAEQEDAAPPSGLDDVQSTTARSGTIATASAYRGSRAQYVRQRAVTAPSGVAGSRPNQPRPLTPGGDLLVGGVHERVRERPVPHDDHDERASRPRSRTGAAAAAHWPSATRRARAQAAPSGRPAQDVRDLLDGPRGERCAVGRPRRGAVRRAMSGSTRDAGHHLAEAPARHERARPPRWSRGRRRRTSRARATEHTRPTSEGRGVAPPHARQRERRARVTTPGMPIRPASASPVEQVRRGIANVTNRAGSRVESTPERDERDHPPAEHEQRADEHHHEPADVRAPARSARPSSPTTHDGQRAEPVERADDEADDLPRAAPQAVAQQRQLQADEVRNHASPSPLTRPPTRSTNRSSRLLSPRTSSTVPAASTCPAAMTATWSHMRWTRSMTCEDTMTVPPERDVGRRGCRGCWRRRPGRRPRTARPARAARGACTIAQASATFLVMPAEYSTTSVSGVGGQVERRQQVASRARRPSPGPGRCSRPA